MNKLNNKLILAFGILVFIVGLLMASSAHARSSQFVSGIQSYSTYVSPTQYIENNVASYYNTQNRVIAGCDNRNTGFSITTGESCARNYVNNTSVATASTVKNTTTNTTNTTNSTNSSQVIKDSNTSSENSDKVSLGSDVNDSYGSLTANAFLGSNSFMPSGILQWIFLIIIITAIIFLWRYVHAEEKYMTEPMKHA